MSDAFRNATHRVGKSVCSYCGVGCGVEVAVEPSGRIHLRGDEAHPTNRGMLCSKGLRLHDVVMDHSDRLLYPQMRRSRGHGFERVSWDDALDRCSRTFRAFIDRFGRRSVGFYVSGQLLTEEYYIANKLVKGFIGCNNIDTNSRLCMSSAVAAYKKALGDDLVPISYEDIEHTDCMLVAGANPAWCHPILFRRMEQRKAEAPETTLIVVDPRVTPTAAMADIHLQIAPGTDVALFNAVAKGLIDNGWIDREFVQNHVEGFEELRRLCDGVRVEVAAEICQVPAEQIHATTRAIGRARRFLSFWAMGLNQSVAGVDKNLALINLSLITGQIGKPGAGPFSLTGQPNAMGGREVGGLANLLAAHHDLANPEHRGKVARHWGVPSIDERPGLTATEMFDALAADELKAIWIVCTNPAVSLPDAERIEAALRKARFVVVQDISSSSDTLPFADVVLPAAGWLEKSGTMTNSERRVTYLPKLVDPPGEALPDAEIFCRFAAKMGWASSFGYKSAADIFDEHRALTAGTDIDVSGLSHARLEHEGPIQWPCSSERAPGATRLFKDGRFAHRSGRARVHAIPFSRSAELSAQFPFVLTTGRVRDQWHTRTRTGKVGKLSQADWTPFVEIHPNDAGRLGIEHGAPVTIRSSAGSACAEARVTDGIKEGAVFLPMHVGRRLAGGTGCANNATESRVDPVSKEPDFKFVPVAVEAEDPAARTVAVIGAGTAARAFVERYAGQRPQDAIHVFGDEREAFYLRPLLPNIVADRCEWTDLAAGSVQADRFTLHLGERVDEIDRENRRVRTRSGKSLAYDYVVIATGSRSAEPKWKPPGMEGVFGVRSRIDAEQLRSAAGRSKRAVIVGGGLLGLEMADALAKRGVRCTLLHRSSMLMRGALDGPAERMLRSHLAGLGIDVRLNDTVLNVHGRERVEGVRTTTGTYLECDLLVCAVGVESNSGLALDAGLDVRRGIVVNSSLRTSDDRIYAIGEAAEFRGRMYGTAPAVQEQAIVAADHLAGHLYREYAGSVPYNVLKLERLQIAVIGESADPDTSTEIALDADEKAGRYRKLVFRNNRLVGAILFGDTSRMGQYLSWISGRIEIDEERVSALHPTASKGASSAPSGTLVCSCHGVGEGDIVDAIGSGTRELGEICARTKAGTGCGSCRPEVAALLRRSVDQPGAAAPEAACV